MAAIGGSIVEVTVGGRIFPATADADGARRLGGHSKTLEPNGDGVTARVIMTRTTWQLGGIVLSCDDSRGDQEYLQAIEDDPDDVEISVKLASGIVYAGVGSVIEDLEAATMASTVAVSLAGPGKLERQ